METTGKRPLRHIRAAAAAAVIALASAGISEAQYDGIPRFFSYVDALRLRDRPSIEGKVLGVLPKGLLVPLVELEEKPSVIDGIRNRWIQVRYGSMEGWAFGGYLVWHQLKDGEKIPAAVTVEKKAIPVTRWRELDNAVVLMEPQKFILYLDAAEKAPLYRERPGAAVPLEKSITRTSGFRADFTNGKTLFFPIEKYYHPGEYGMTGYYLFNHPDHGRVWVADCHTHQVADTMKWNDTVVLLGAGHPLWEGDRNRFRLMLWNTSKKKFVFGTMPLLNTSFSYSSAKFLMNREKDGALNLQIEARNETQPFDPTGDFSLENPFYNIYAVVTESGVAEMSRYEIIRK